MGGVSDVVGYESERKKEHRSDFAGVMLSRKTVKFLLQFFKVVRVEVNTQNISMFT